MELTFVLLGGMCVGMAIGYCVGTMLTDFRWQRRDRRWARSVADYNAITWEVNCVAGVPEAPERITMSRHGTEYHYVKVHSREGEVD